jgi:tetratricopeptide (TPR) repeat protein
MTTHATRPYRNSHSHLVLMPLRVAAVVAGTVLLMGFGSGNSGTKNAEAHVAVARLYLGQSRWSLAEEQYRVAIAIDGARSGYHLDLGSLLANEGQLAEAETEIRTAIKLAPEDAQAHLALGDLLNAESGREDEAETEFARARALDPDASPANSPPVTTMTAA